MIKGMVLRIAKWACVKKGFVDLKINDIMHNWRVCLTMGISKKKMKSGSHVTGLSRGEMC